MIPNITRGSDFGKLMRYLVGPGRANEHTMPHLVTGDPAIMTWFDSSELGAADAAALADDLARPSVLSGRAPKAGAVWHCSLAVAVEDGPLTDEQWAEVAQRFMDKMNFSAEASGRSPMPWLAVHHGQSKNGNDHIHLVVSTVREDGTFVDTHRDFARAQQASREIETELGLRQLQGPQVGLGAKGLTGAELNLSGRTGREPSRVTLERAVRAAATMSVTEADFVAAVRGMDIRIAPYFAAGRSDVVAGYKVGLKGPGERMFGGGHLSKDLSLPRLRLRWEDTPQAHLEAAKQWRRSDRETRVGGAAPKRPAPRPVDEINQRLFRIEQRLATVRPDDVETWGQIAGDTAGILAAWSRSREGDTPGPLAAAAAATRQLGQSHRWAITGRRTIRPTSTDAALLAHQFTIGGHGAVGQAIFMRQLTNTLFAIHQAALAMKQARIAESIAVAVNRDLVQVIAQLPAIPEHVLHGRCPTVAEAQAAIAAPTRPLGRPMPEVMTPTQRAALNAAATSNPTSSFER